MHSTDSNCRMADQIRLRQVFDQFASFGSSRNLASAAETTMDNAHFAKLCRDTKLIGKTLTTVDVDICFKKVLPFAHCIDADCRCAVGGDQGRAQIDL